VQGLSTLKVFGRQHRAAASIERVTAEYRRETMRVLRVSFLSGFAQDYSQLLALRTLQGFGFGAEWAVGAVLLGELVTPANRGKALGAVQSAAGPGSALAALLAGPVAAMFAPTMGWRVAFFIGVVPAVLVFFVRREDDDADIFKRAKARAQQQGRTFLPVEIFSPKLRRRTALACLLALGGRGIVSAGAGLLATNLLSALLAAAFAKWLPRPSAPSSPEVRMEAMVSAENS